MGTISAQGRTFECRARPYHWPHGFGVTIEISELGKAVGVVCVLCARNDERFEQLAQLTEDDRCELAVSRFSRGQLNTSIDQVVKWQADLLSLGFDYVSPLYVPFSKQ